MKVVSLKAKPKRKGLSWVWMFVLIAVTSGIMAAVTNPSDKKLKYEATLPEWNQKFNSMDTVKMVIADSDIPAVTRRYVIGILNKIQTDIAIQLTPQIEADKKLNEKPPLSKQDTTQKKTN